MLREHARASEDGLAQVIDKLRADHRTLAGHLDDVERSLDALPGDPEARAEAATMVERLAEHLEAHLAFEEQSLAPALTAVSSVVSEAAVPPPPPESFGIASGGH
jgi:hemerythrin-like domain-containing protein